MITATLPTEPGVSDTAVDTTTVIHVPGVELVQDEEASTDPGTKIVYVDTLTNTGNLTDTFTLSFDSSKPRAAVSPTLAFDLDPWESRQVWVTITVPLEEVSGTVDITVVTATSQLNPGVLDVIADTTTVNQVGGVQFVADEIGSGEPGEDVTYSHTLTNTGNGTDTFALHR